MLTPAPAHNAMRMRAQARLRPRGLSANVMLAAWRAGALSWSLCHLGEVLEEEQDAAIDDVDHRLAKKVRVCACHQGGIVESERVGVAGRTSLCVPGARLLRDHHALYLLSPFRLDLDTFAALPLERPAELPLTR